MRIGIDIGGTFTDFVAYDEQTGRFDTFKILSTPSEPARGVLDGRKLMNAVRADVVHGSTVATNALLERKGSRTALVTTAGFADVLAIGRQERSNIYDLRAPKPIPLVPADLRFEVSERVDCTGQIITPLRESDLPALAVSLREKQAQSVAVCFLFSFLKPEHEKRVAQFLRDSGFFVCASCEILPEFREYERTSTTVINAYVSPIMDRYLGELEQHGDFADFRVMQSNGGSMTSRLARAQGVHSVLSGPAGGVIGARYVASAAGFDRIIPFDMGGTSTDVSLCDRSIPYTTESHIGGLPVRIPVIDIHTVGAGGGSIASIDAGGALIVCPQSAGADPGPACYGRGGTNPTVTDSNLVLGRLVSDYFLGGRMKLDAKAANDALSRLAQSAGLEAKGELSPAQRAAAGVIAIVNANMERALRVISVERGQDPADFVLVCFGGAGGLHAVDLARGVGIRRVLFPRNGSTLSAMGMLTADVVQDFVQTIMLRNPEADELLKRAEPLVQEGKTVLAREKKEEGQIEIRRELDVRYVGQSYELTVLLGDNYAESFHKTHEATYGHAERGKAIEVVNIRVRLTASVPRPKLTKIESTSSDASSSILARRPIVINEKVVEAPFYRGEDLKTGHKIAGPAVVVYKDTTVYLSERDLGIVDVYGNLVVQIG